MTASEPTTTAASAASGDPSRPWLASYPEGVPHSIAPYPEVSLYSFLETAARTHPDRVAVSFFGKRLTYAEVLREAERFSAVLASLGVNKGDRVGYVLPNCPQYVIAFFATLRLGAVAVGNNPLYTQAELLHQLKDAGIKVLVVLDQLYSNVAATRDEAGIERVVVTKLTDYMKFPLTMLAPVKFRKDAKKEGKPWPPVPADAEVESWSSLMRTHGTTGAEAPPVADVDARRDAAAFVYTGGTTGPSKGAMLSHFNLVSNAMQSAAWCTLKDAGESVMCVLPFFHAYGMTTEMNTGIYRAATLVLVPRFELHMVLKAIQKERPTIFPGVPRLYQQINDAPETAKYDLRSIRACVSGAAPLPRTIAEKFESLTGGNLVEGYGMTEASPVTHANPLEGKRKAGSIGLPIPDTECRIVALDEPDREVESGEPGELVIRGPQVMLGYHGHPDETAMTVRDGWLHTGDIATVDADGFFAIVDRLKEMIIVSGFNVYPTEIEDALLRYSKIQKVSVVGVPDTKTGEAVKAFVVLRPGESATADEIIAFAREQLSGYRVPKQIEFRDSLPETMIGKVLRRVLLEEERAKAKSAPASSS